MNSKKEKSILNNFFELLCNKGSCEKDIDISIIIPTYKSNLSLKCCLQSIDEQLFLEELNIEVVLVLNGKRNPYADFVFNILKQVTTENITFVYSFAKGVSQARNLGLQLSKGEYICFIDDDDWISESYLMDLYEISKKGKIGLANMLDFENDVFKSSYFTSTHEKFTEKKITPNLLTARSWFSVPVLKMLDRKILRGKKFKEGLNNGEDSLFMFDVLTFNPKLEVASSAVYYRRVCTEGLTLTLKRKGVLTRILHALNLSSLFLCHYIKSGFKQNFLFFITRILAPFKNI